MTIVNNPNVRMIMGKEIIFKTGFTIKLSSPKTTPAIAYSLTPPLKENPATSQVAAYKATELPNILIINPIILTVIILSFLNLKFNLARGFIPLLFVFA